MKKRLISLLLAFSMMLTFLPAGAVSAFAEENIGDIIADGATIEQGGTYRLSGEYTKRITINTSDPVTINIAKGDTIKNAGSDLLLMVGEGGKLTLNNEGTYEGEDFLYFEGDKAEISGGKYIITRGTAFTFVDGIEIQGKTNTDGIKVGALRGIYANKTPNVKIKNSTINVNGDLYGAIYVEGYKAEATLDNVTAHAISRPTIIDYAGKLTINSGRYTNNNCTDVIVSNMASAMKVDVIINGGEFEGGTNVKPTLDVSTRRGYPEATLKIHGGTFTSTQSGLVLRNYATVKIDSSISMPKFYSQSGSLNAIENRAIGEYGIWGNGNLQFDDGIIEVLGTSKRAALYTCGDEPYVRTVVNGGKIHGAGYGIHVGDGSPVVVLKDVEFKNNDADIYLNANQKITIEETFKNNATVGCADPKDGRQLTTATTGEYQKDLNLTSADEDYLVGYKTEDGKEYRCLSKKVGVTINGLKGEIKAEDPAEFTVTLTHAGSTGTGTLTFGDKNGEIEYQDDNGVYQPMPKDGLPIKLASDKNDYAFRITPKDAGKQTLTAAVVRDDVKLGTADKDYTVAGRVHTTVAIEGLEDAVIKEGESKDFTVKVTPNDDAKMGEAFIDFGDKNGEIEYKDENDKYVPMPKDGLPIDLASGKNDYVFHITPKNAGDQKLTAAVVRDDVELGTAEENFTVAGRVHTTVAIEGLEDAVIKEGESKDFTVKVTPNDDANLGEAFIDFGDKNSEIEYKDENGEYQPMPENGLKINLGDGETEYKFRIAPKETGKQTLTAAVKKGENELARDEKDFVVSEMPILTLKDGVITSVTVPGKDGADPEDITEIVKKNANEDGSFNVPEGATVSVAFDKDAFADSGLKFGHWDITGLDDPNAYQNKESFAFVMPAKGVTLKAMTQDASIEDDEPDIVGPIVIGTTVVVGGAVLGYQAYSLGAEFAGKLMALPYFPSNRSALAMMLWEDAGKPMPESELLYPDVGQEERDMDLQHAARWAMENELIPDLNDEGTAPEEMKFYPDNTVSKIDVLNAWQKAQELKQNA